MIFINYHGFNILYLFQTRCVVQVRWCQQVNDENKEIKEAGRNCQVQENSFYPEDNIKLNLANDCTGYLEKPLDNDIDRRSNQNDEVNVLTNQQDTDHVSSYVRTEDLRIENFQNQQDVNNASSYVHSEDLQNIDLRYVPSHKGTENFSKTPYCQNMDSFSTCVNTEDLQKYLPQQNVDDVLYSRTELLQNNQDIQNSPPVQEIKADKSNDVSSESLNHHSQPANDSSSFQDQTDSGFQSNSGYISHEKLNNLG